MSLINTLRAHVEQCEAKVLEIEGQHPTGRTDAEIVKAVFLREEIGELESQLAGLRADLDELERPIRQLQLAEDAVTVAWSELRRAERARLDV